jgi:hypothetical protein
MSKLITFGVPAAAIAAITIASAPVALVGGIAALTWGLWGHD